MMTLLYVETHMMFTLRSENIFDKLKSFKNDEKCFLFHLRGSFHFQDIYHEFSLVEKTAQLER